LLLTYFPTISTTYFYNPTLWVKFYDHRDANPKRREFLNNGNDQRCADLASTRCDYLDAARLGWHELHDEWLE